MKKDIDEANYAFFYWRWNLIRLIIIYEQLMWSCKCCRNLFGSHAYWWTADCTAPFPTTGLIWVGDMHSFTCGVRLRRANTFYSRNIMVIWDAFKMWAIMDICVLAQIKRGFKCLQCNIILQRQKKSRYLNTNYTSLRNRSHNVSPLRSHEVLQYQKVIRISLSESSFRKKTR